MDRISTPIHRGTNLSREESVEIDNTIMAAVDVIEHHNERQRVQFVRDWNGTANAPTLLTVVRE